MVKLAANQQSFINLMKKSNEHARRGFELLLARTDFDDFFDPLQEAGLFSPSQNPGPIPAGEPGYVQIPYWDALNYLEAIAKRADEKKDLQLAEKVMTVVRSVSRAREPDGSIRDNHHTYWKFATILGLIPTAAITTEDIDLIPGWLRSKFDRGMVGTVLDQGALRRFLASDSPTDWDKACLILRHCTAILWVDEKELGNGRKKPLTVVEDYWLKELIEHNADTLGAKIGGQAADILLGRIREVYGQDGSNLASYWKRPAIENHAQNHTWDRVYNRFVEGLRDVLLSWVDHDLIGAHAFVEVLLRDEAEIVRRIGIYIMNQRWTVLQSIYPTVLDHPLFDDGHLHELYNLLREHFHELTEEEKAATVKAIRQIPPSTRDEDPDRRLRYIQRNWLSAIAGKGYEPADTWFDMLQSDATIGTLREHPDFHSYHESWSGPGASPYSVQELLAFAEDGSIIERLNDFQQKDSWHSPTTPTTHALVDTLEEAVGINPQQFLRLLPEFLKAKHAYQYGIINGFKRVPEDNQFQIDWDRAREALIGFFESIIEDDTFWAENVVTDSDSTSNRDWLPPLIAGFLHSNTQDDISKVFPPRAPRIFALIRTLLKHVKPMPEASEDAMSQAINSSKGKTIEALFSHVTGERHMSDPAPRKRAEAWAQLKSIFDDELAQCKNTNFEFSTLAGAYITDLDYLDHEWLVANVEQIFTQEFPVNFTCALEGLAFAPATRPIYALLLDRGILDWALWNAPEGRHSREKLIERIAVAYLWGDEELDSSRFSYLFESGKAEELVVASRFFWNLRGQTLTTDQIERILLYWEQCVAWSHTASAPTTKLLSSLSVLSYYINSVEDREKKLLHAVAPHVHVDPYNADDFIKELNRLADKNPAVISAVFKEVLKSYKPLHDYQDRLKSLITKLAECGERVDARVYADQLRDIQGMPEVFDQLKQKA